MSSPTIIILALLLFIAVLNGNDIVKYIEWLRFKIRTYFKQMQNNERYNTTQNRSRELFSEQQEVYKDSNGNWIARQELTTLENNAFSNYRKAVIENTAFKKHTKATYSPKR